MDTQQITYGPVRTTTQIGHLLRARRKEIGSTHIDVAGIANLDREFIASVERGTPTSEIGKVLHLLQQLGLEMVLLPRGAWERKIDKADIPTASYPVPS